MDSSDIINDLAKGISSTAKLFANDISTFSVVNDINVSADLVTISMWAYQWKMYFNPDISKQAQKITFSKKNFNKTRAVVCSYQKHLGVFLDKMLNFNTILKKKLQKQASITLFLTQEITIIKNTFLNYKNKNINKNNYNSNNKE